ncbi:AAA family ATPase [Acinetobacter rathckeae]|uniref:AAA family ATPase n=1 Tax=Acinetobacter rathckeae TaxID=2605272 RepID=UPI001D197B02|nr:AAA family ATPase [Acinetobacter rathckeae]
MINTQDFERFKASFDGKYTRLERDAESNWNMLFKIKKAFPYLDIYTSLFSKDSQSSIRYIRVGIKKLTDQQATQFFFDTYNDIDENFIKVNISKQRLLGYLSQDTVDIDHLFTFNGDGDVFLDEKNIDVCLGYLKPIIEADCIKASIDLNTEGHLPNEYMAHLLELDSDLKNQFNIDRIQLFLKHLDYAQVESFYQVIQSIRTVFPKIDIYHAGSGKYGYLGFGRKKTITSRVQDFLLVSHLGNHENNKLTFKLGVISALAEYIGHYDANFSLTLIPSVVTGQEVTDWLSKLKQYALQYEMNLEGSGRYPIDYLDSPLQAYDDIAGLETYMTNTTPLNQILFGPAGTGKTYHTVNHAVEIVDPEFYRLNQDNRVALKQAFDGYVDNGQIKFVTFHQSFSYEDFIEGIRASTKDGQIHYEVESGVFKRLCQTASENHDCRAVEHLSSLGSSISRDEKIDQAIDELIEKSQIEEVKLNSKTGVAIFINGDGNDQLEVRNSQGNTKIITKNAIKNYVNNPSDHMTYQDTYTWTIAKYIRDAIDDGHAVSLSDESDLDKKIDRVIDAFVKKAQEQEIELKTKTGKSFGVRANLKGNLEALTSRETSVPLSKKYIKDYLKSLNIETINDGTSYQWAIAQFLRPDVYGIHIQQPEKKIVLPSRYVMIIDEINRGNISRIFGELITLIDESKRSGQDNTEALSTILPYSKEPLSVPNNLYILGTMNSSDHSLTGLDLALRRRFNFIEMKPDLTPLEGVYVEGINIKTLLERLNQRIEILLDLQHCIGQAYFMPLEEKPYMSVLGEIFLQKILPLLQEYFFDDWQKIVVVLNHNQMVEKKYDADQVSKLFRHRDIDVAREVWQINKDALGQANQYIEIYQDM